MDRAVRSTVTRSNEALLRIVHEYKAGGLDSVAQLDVACVPVMNRLSPFASTRPDGIATRSAAVGALQAVGIPSADPSTPGFFYPCSLGFPSARAAAMAAGAPGSSREMELPPGFASTPMHPPMTWGKPRRPAPNGVPRFAPPPFSRPRARRQPTATSAARFLTAATATYQPTCSPALPPPPPGFGV
nr:protein transport protein sec31-like [Lolium perenne]